MPAAAANEECRCTSQFEGVVYSNIVVAGLASNMTRGKSQTSVAHVVYDRARTHSTQECRHALHDEIVGVGPLCQLGYNEMPREEAYLRGLMQSLGVPSSLTEIGIEPAEEYPATIEQALVVSRHYEGKGLDDLARPRRSIHKMVASSPLE